MKTAVRRATLKPGGDAAALAAALQNSMSQESRPGTDESLAGLKPVPTAEQVKTSSVEQLRSWIANYQANTEIKNRAIADLEEEKSAI